MFGERCLQVAEALQNLATVLDAQGHAREAEELLDQALGIEEEVRTAISLYTVHVQNCTVHNILSIRFGCFHALYCTDCVSHSPCCCKIRGKDSVENGVTMNNLGVLAAHLGNLPRAQVLLRRTLSLRRRDLGEGHELTQCSQRNLQHVERAIAEGREYATINNADEVKSPQEEENEDAVE